MDIQHIRKAYRLKRLSSEDLQDNPIAFFKTWFLDAINAEIEEANAAALATASQSGKPSCRMVLIKHIEEDGILFFTNYESPKAKDLEENPYAALTFWWKELERQVRFEGKVVKCSEAISAEYFAKRPKPSQIAAWASQQSVPLASREVLEQNYAQLKDQFAGGLVPLPPHWGGYRLIPEQIEFWQGREDRLHDRFLYTKTSNDWTWSRLSP